MENPAHLIRQILLHYQASTAIEEHAEVLSIQTCYAELQWPYGALTRKNLADSGPLMKLPVATPFDIFLHKVLSIEHDFNRS
jgi:hypothetical protein